MKYSDFVNVCELKMVTVSVRNRENSHRTDWNSGPNDVSSTYRRRITTLKYFMDTSHAILHQHKVPWGNPAWSSCMSDVGSEFCMFFLPGRCLLRWPVGDKTPPHRRAVRWAGSPSGTEGSCPPGDQRWAADWQKPHRRGTAVPGEWWVCDGHFWWWLECRWWTGSRAAGELPPGPLLPSDQGVVARGGVWPRTHVSHRYVKHMK